MKITLNLLKIIFTECFWEIMKEHSHENINVNSSKPILLPASVMFALGVQFLTLSKGLFLIQIDTEIV